MYHRFDYLGKEIGEEALGPSGRTVVQAQISSEVQHADIRHEPDPAREAERARLGLLGRVAVIACLIELYAHAPGAAEFRACLEKYLAFWQELARKARRAAAKAKKLGQPVAPGVEPFLWLITAGCPVSVLRALKFKRGRGWPRGVYFFGDDVLHVGIIVASELPRTRATLLVRLVAAGPLLSQAIADLAALPADAYERTVAEQILVRLQQVLARKPSRTPEEQEFIVTMHTSWEEAREEGREEGGRAHARATLRTILALRHLVTTERDEAQIDRCNDLSTLDRWIAQALGAQSVAEALRVNGATRRRGTSPRAS